MKKIVLFGEEWYWPDSDVAAARYYSDEHNYYLPGKISSICDRKRCVIQAGGYTGFYAAQYSRLFEKVYTFEPDDDNYECLSHNVQDVQNCYHRKCALGSEHKKIRVQNNAENTGNCTVTDDTGNIECMTIDSLELHNVDLLHLDIEGYEYHALLGAKNTIDKFKPLIVLETNGFCKNFGISEEQIKKYLQGLGYGVHETWANDTVFAYQGL